MSAQPCGCDQEAHWVCEQHRDVFDDVIAERDMLRQQVAILTRELEELRRAVSRDLRNHAAVVALAEAHHQDSDDVDRYTEKIERLKARVATLTAECDGIHQQLAEAQADGRKYLAATEREIALTRKKAEAEAERTRARWQLEDGQQERDAMQRRAESAESNCQAAEQQIATLTEALEVASAEATRLRAVAREAADRLHEQIGSESMDADDVCERVLPELHDFLRREASWREAELAAALEAVRKER